MAQVTLSIDTSVLARARRYAQRRGTSLSKLVEDYLETITAPPVLRSLRGILKNVDRRDSRKHLADKYL